MGSRSTTDQTETDICNLAQAEDVLSALPNDHQQLDHWHIWSNKHFSNQPWHQRLCESMTIAYARMTCRNGSLNKKPRSYHNEFHINDLLSRVVYCAKNYKQQLNATDLALLSYFAACHDLRQNEPKLLNDPESLVGSNEQASYEEALRIIELVGDSSLWNEHNKLLLKTMIEGSTFGSGGQRSKYFFQGNLAKHLLDKLALKNKHDEQLVLLACDIDTANVSLPISEFAQSAVHIYDELISHQLSEICAHQFFSEQQKIFFFDQQNFNADISKKLFQPHKQTNSDKLIRLSDHVGQLPENMSDAKIKAAFLAQARKLEPTK